MTEIAVTGSTGVVGGIAARLLVNTGSHVRLLVRDASRAPHLENTEVFETSYGDPSAADALAGVSTAFMVSGHESDDRVAQHQAFVDAAKAVGVQHLVYLSFIGASADSTFTLARDHGATEDYIRASGLDYTFVRDNFYAEVLVHFADEDGLIAGPAGNGKVAAVSQRDVGEVVALILRDPSAHVGKTYNLTGPEALTLDDVAVIASRVTGKQFTYKDETIEEARASRAHFGAPDWQVDAWISTYTAIRDGEMETVTDDVHHLLGRESTSLAEALATEE
jgi:NAD(P)H dehydrogenase (quinone)